MPSDRLIINETIGEWSSGAGVGVLVPTVLGMLCGLEHSYGDAVTVEGVCDALTRLPGVAFGIRATLLKKAGYREVKISRISHYGSNVDMGFEDSAVVLQVSKAWLAVMQIESDDLRVGVEILIKGRDGNDDVQLARPDALSDLKLKNK